MAVTEKQRHQFFKQAEEVFGPDGAETLMELLPPVGWADVATKHDLDALRAATKQDIDLVRQELKGDIDLVRVELKGDIASLRADFERTLRQQLVTTLTANAVMVGLAVSLTQLLG